MSAKIYKIYIYSKNPNFEKTEMFKKVKSVFISEERILNNEIEQVLGNFERVNEWLDLVKHIQALQQFFEKLKDRMRERALEEDDKPKKPPIAIENFLERIAFRLNQCLRSELPSGIHLKALDAYSSFFLVLDDSQISKNFPYFAKGIFPLISFSGEKVLEKLFEIHNYYFVPLADKLSSVIEGMMESLLPGLEEPHSKQCERTKTLLDNIRKLSDRGIFVDALWENFIFAKEYRQNILNYLNLAHENYNRKNTMKLIPNNKNLMLKAINYGLKDEKESVKNSTLGFFIKNFSQKEQIFDFKSQSGIISACLVFAYGHSKSLSVKSRQYLSLLEAQAILTKNIDELDNVIESVLTKSFNNDGESFPMSLKMLEVAFKTFSFFKEKESLHKIIILSLVKFKSAVFQSKSFESRKIVILFKTIDREIIWLALLKESKRQFFRKDDKLYILLKFALVTVLNVFQSEENVKQDSKKLLKMMEFFMKNINSLSEDTQETAFEFCLYVLSILSYRFKKIEFSQNTIKRFHNTFKIEFIVKNEVNNLKTTNLITKKLKLASKILTMFKVKLKDQKNQILKIAIPYVKSYILPLLNGKNYFDFHLPTRNDLYQIPNLSLSTSISTNKTLGSGLKYMRKTNENRIIEKENIEKVMGNFLQENKINSDIIESGSKQRPERYFETRDSLELVVGAVSAAVDFYEKFGDSDSFFDDLYITAIDKYCKLISKISPRSARDLFKIFVGISKNNKFSVRIIKLLHQSKNNRDIKTYSSLLELCVDLKTNNNMSGNKRKDELMKINVKFIETSDESQKPKQNIEFRQFEKRIKDLSESILEQVCCDLVSGDEGICTIIISWVKKSRKNSGKLYGRILTKIKEFSVIEDFKIKNSETKALFGDNNIRCIGKSVVENVEEASNVNREPLLELYDQILTLSEYCGKDFFDFLIESVDRTDYQTVFQWIVSIPANVISKLYLQDIDKIPLNLYHGRSEQTKENRSMNKDGQKRKFVENNSRNLKIYISVKEKIIVTKSVVLLRKLLVLLHINRMYDTFARVTEIICPVVVFAYGSALHYSDSDFLNEISGLMVILIITGAKSFFREDYEMKKSVIDYSFLALEKNTQLFHTDIYSKILKNSKKKFNCCKKEIAYPKMAETPMTSLKEFITVYESLLFFVKDEKGLFEQMVSALCNKIEISKSFEDIKTLIHCLAFIIKNFINEATGKTPIVEELEFKTISSEIKRLILTKKIVEKLNNASNLMRPENTLEKVSKPSAEKLEYKLNKKLDKAFSVFYSIFKRFRLGEFIPEIDQNCGKNSKRGQGNSSRKTEIKNAENSIPKKIQGKKEILAKNGFLTREDDLFIKQIKEIKFDILSTFECIFECSSQFFFEQLVFAFWKKAKSTIKAAENKKKEKSVFGPFKRESFDFKRDFLLLVDSCSFSNPSFVIHNILSLSDKKEKEEKLTILFLIEIYVGNSKIEKLKSSWSSLKALFPEKKKAVSKDLDSVLLFLWKFKIITCYIERCGITMASGIHEEEIVEVYMDLVKQILSLCGIKNLLPAGATKIFPILLENPFLGEENSQSCYTIVETKGNIRVDLLALHFLAGSFSGLLRLFEGKNQEETVFAEISKIFKKILMQSILSNKIEETHKKRIVLRMAKSLCASAGNGSFEDEVDELFARTDFFSYAPAVLRSWSALITQISNSSSIGSYLQKNQGRLYETEAAKALRLKKLAFIIFSLPLDYFKNYFGEIMNLALPALSQGSGKATLESMFLVLRVTLYRSSRASLQPFLDDLVLKIVSLSKALSFNPLGSKELEFVFSLLQLLDALFVFHTRLAFKNRWALVGRPELISRSLRESIVEAREAGTTGHLILRENRFVPALTLLEIKAAISSGHQGKERGSSSSSKNNEEDAFVQLSPCFSHKNNNLAKKRPLLADKSRAEGEAASFVSGFHDQLRSFFECEAQKERELDSAFVENCFYEEFSQFSGFSGFGDTAELIE